MLSPESGYSVFSNEINHYLSGFIPAIDDVSSKVALVAGQTGALFLGMTGEGKSTLLNYLYGINYQKYVASGIKKVRPLGVELVKTGDSTRSETLYPQIVRFPYQPYVGIELPGFADTRGEIEETCAAVAISSLTTNLIALQALVLVSSWNSLESSKMLNYRHAASCLGALLHKDPNTTENLLLVVTHLEKDLSVDDVRERLRDLLDAEGGNGEITIKQEDVTQDVWKKYCIRNVTRAFLSHEGNIVLADVTTDKTRLEFQKAILPLQRKLKHPQQFNFERYSLFVEKFQNVLKRYAFDYVQTATDRNQSMASLQETSFWIHVMENELCHLSNSLNDLNQPSSQFDSRPHQQLIDGFQQSIQYLKASLLNSNYEKTNHEKRLIQIQSQIVLLASDRTEKKNSLWNDVNIDFEILPRILQEMESIQRIIPSDSTVKYHLSSPQITLSGVFVSKQDLMSKIRNQLEISVFQKRWRVAPFQLEFFQVRHLCNTPESQLFLRDLHQQFEETQKLLERNRKNHLVIENQIRDYELLESKESIRMENSKLLHMQHVSMKKEELNASILNKKRELEILRSKREHLHGTVELSRHHQAAQQMLSLKVSKIIQMLCFRDPIFSNFNALLQEATIKY